MVEDWSTLEEICAYLKNWFDRNQPRIINTHHGLVTSLSQFDQYSKVQSEFGAKDGVILGGAFGSKIEDGQFYRIVGSTFNDGIHRYHAGETDDTLLNEPQFPVGAAIWFMAVPMRVLKGAEKVAQWEEEYLAVGSQALSPYNSESFGGYSYSKSSGGSSESTGGNAPIWWSQFGHIFAPWRKI